MKSAFQKALDRIPHIPPLTDEEPFFYLNHSKFDTKLAVIAVQPRYVESQGSYLCPREVTISEIPLLDGKTRSQQDRDTRFQCGTQSDGKPLTTFVGLCRQLSDEFKTALDMCRTKGEQSTNEELADRYAKGYRALERAQVQFPAWANRQATHIMTSLNSEYIRQYTIMESEIASSSNDEASIRKMEANDHMSQNLDLLGSQELEYQKYCKEKDLLRTFNAGSGRSNQSIKDTTEGFNMDEKKTWSLGCQALKQRAASLIGKKSKAPTMNENS